MMEFRAVTQTELKKTLLPFLTEPMGLVKSFLKSPNNKYTAIAIPATLMEIERKPDGTFDVKISGGD